ncbi:MAG: tripartite tricarboxylate transporter substrate binding protein [Deltaproteobacteria bacterium]|nr:tripartite tricarboxylate transporter substrate binding protein [Deltaproteobacteria bacterium]
MKKRIFIILMAASFLGMLFTVFTNVSILRSVDSAAWAAYPDREVTLIVTYSPGGGTDRLGRILAKLVEKHLGKPMVVMNKTGAGGAVGYQFASRAKPDGYTCVVTVASQLTNEALGRKELSMSYFDPVIRVNLTPGAITIRADAPYKTLNEFINYMRKNPGKVKLGGSAPGSTWHFNALQLSNLANVKIKYIPYTGGASPAIMACLGGHIDGLTVSMAEVAPQVDAGKFRILCINSDERSPKYPNVPTSKELGYPLVIGAVRGIGVPKNTPENIKKKLHDAFYAVMQETEFKEFMEKNGFGIGYLNGADYDAYNKKMLKIYSELAKKVGLKKKK